MQQSPPSTLMALGALGQVGWLSQQPADFQLRMIQAGRWQTVAQGRSIYDAGDDPDALYGLEAGMLDVEIPILGDEQVTIHRAMPGFWIGDSAVLAQSARTISIRAASDARVLRIGAAAIRRLLDDSPADWKRFYLLSHLNATLALRVLAEVLSLPSRARYARMLLRLADPQGIVRITQEELSRMAGMNRASFRRAFLDLIEKGVVSTEYGGLRILDRAALEEESCIS